MGGWILNIISALQAGMYKEKWTEHVCKVQIEMIPKQLEISSDVWRKCGKTKG